MNPDRARPRSPASINGQRRTVLAAALFGLPGAWLASQWGGPIGALHAQTSAPAIPADFIAVSRTLTGHADLRAEMAEAAWHGLVRQMPDFPDRFTQLAQALQGATITGYEQLADSALAKDAASKATIMAILGAWYLGRVGPVVARADVGPAQVSYTGALMWRPTLDATVLPSYAVGRPGHWSTPPRTLATD